MSNKNRSYTDEFKQEAIKLALSSESVASAASALGIPDGTLHTWVKKAKQLGEVASIAPGETVNIGEIIEENQELKKRLARLEQEKAILKKAATYFAKELA